MQTSAFVGREAELGALDAALERAVRFRAPQAVTVVGALGMGKTRLLDHWLERRQAALPVRAVRATAVAMGEGETAPPRSLIGALLRHRFGIDDSVDASEALRRFRAELRTVFEDRRVAEVAALLGGFLGFELPESPLLRALVGKPEQGADL